MPDYEIVEWNEDNFDINCIEYAEYCYDKGKYAFLSDFVRLAVVCEYGGLYFDTDVEIVSPPDELLSNGAFFGFENNSYVATGLGFGAEANHPVIASMKQQYLQLTRNEDGSFPLISCPVLNTRALIPLGLRLDGTRQNVNGAEILPKDYMNPYDDPTGRLVRTSNTISIHWYAKSWMSKGTVLRSRITKPFHRVFGNDCFKWLKK